jgi:hypothetical protein
MMFARNIVRYYASGALILLAAVSLKEMISQEMCMKQVAISRKSEH